MDAVSIACFDVDNDGTLPIHTPYALFDTKENLEKSFKLPLPTGHELEIKEDLYKPEEFKELLLEFIGTLFLKNSSGQLILNHSELNPNFEKLLELLSKVKEIKQLSKIDREIDEFKKLIGFPGTNKEFKLFFEERISIIKDTIDEHNTYLNTVSLRKLDKIAKNYVMFNTFEVINDPINLVLALAPIDLMTSPLKKIGNSAELKSKILDRTPGDFTNKALSIVENQVGKEGIGICAVALKSFFGLSAFNDLILKSGNINDLYRIILDDGGITFNGKSYKYLANINAPLLFLNNFKDVILDYISTNFEVLLKHILNNIDLNHINELSNINDKISFLLSINFDNSNIQEVLKLKSILTNYSSLIDIQSLEDMALVLSAMLSLATDNAKELQLAKLNAGTKTIDMYLYGLSIGIPFKELSLTLMTPTGILLVSLLLSNHLTEELGLFNFQALFEYIDIAPKNILKELSNISEKEKDEMPGINSTKFVLKLKDTIVDCLSISDKLKLKFKKLTLQIVIGKLKTDNKAIELLKNTQIFPKNSKLSIRYNKAISLILNYIDTYRKINPTIYENIKKLQNGALEFREMGKLFGLNQGLPTSAKDILSRVKNFETIISERLKIIYNLNEISRKLEIIKTGDTRKKESFSGEEISIGEFCSNEEYLLKYIELYDKIKHSVNILDAIRSVPHFYNYLKELAALHEGLKLTSLKYKFTYELSKNYDLKGKDLEYLYSGLLDYYLSELINSYFLSKGVKFNIPSKSLIHDKTKVFIGEKLIPVMDEFYTIHLGTKDGNASFKYYIETELIPSLQKDSVMKKNLFIKDLKPTSISKTFSGDPMIVYALPINMMPNTIEEESIFNLYKNAFNQLKDAYVEINGLKFPLLDIFYYYGLIANYGKLGLQSLMPIFANLHNLPILQSFHEFEGKFELDPNCIVPEEYRLRPKSVYTSYDKLVRMRDPETNKMTLWRKLTGEDLDYAMLNGEYLINGYSKINSALHDKKLNNYYNMNYSQNGILLLKNYTILYNLTKINTILFKDTIVKPKGIKSLETIPIIEGTNDIDYKQLEILLENYFNPC